MRTPHTLAGSALLVVGALLAPGCGDDRLLILNPALSIAPNPVVVTVSKGALGTAIVGVQNSGAGLLDIEVVTLVSPDGLVTHRRDRPGRRCALEASPACRFRSRDWRERR